MTTLPPKSTGIVLMPLAKSESVYGQSFAYREHFGYVLRLQILFKIGGIYLDPDVIVVKSFDSLYRYPLALVENHRMAYPVARCWLNENIHLWDIGSEPIECIT